MNGNGFSRITEAAFVPFMKALGFSMRSIEISGRQYSVDFVGAQHTVTVAYEPVDDVLTVYVFTRTSGGLSNIDDRVETPRLSDLTRRFMGAVTRDERSANDSYFRDVAPADAVEQRLLKAAKELRLTLPRYLAAPGTLNDQ
jgi:hypothetical protein